jgi:hypothetical protein
MFERHPGRPLYWYWFAEFLLDYYTDRTDEARTALEKADDPTASGWTVPPVNLERLRQRLAPEPAAQ